MLTSVRPWMGLAALCRPCSPPPLRPGHRRTGYLMEAPQRPRGRTELCRAGLDMAVSRATFSLGGAEPQKNVTQH